MFVYLGYTGPSQESINHQFHPSFSQMMFYLNFWAICIVSIALVVTGQLTSGITFIMKYPNFATEVTAFSLASALGQALILFTLLRFNSLIVVTITT